MRPDSNDKSLIADNENRCDLSTFLDNGDILLKVNRRYLVFDKNGNSALTTLQWQIGPEPP